MSFPEQPFGFVAGRWVRSIGDTPDDPDRAPDYVPVENATVVFTPQVTHRVAADGPGWAGIIKDRVSARVGERGQLIDTEGHDHLALAAGIYSVMYDFGPGWSWPSHYIEVKPEHTTNAPLWLPPITPPPDGPMIENRVVTIPADGQDGQVLVWDGGGFSWDFPPKGDKGDQGEVTTAALTTALAGKVTGTGMSVRVDNSVGTCVFLDHPGGSTMLYGDTGWRTITSWDETGELTGTAHTNITATPGVAGSIQVRRENNTVTFVMRGFTFVNGAELNLPSGFRGTAPYGSWPMTLPDRVGRASVGGNQAYIPTLGTDMILNPLYGAMLVFRTDHPWPTTLPGTPA